MRPMNSDPAVRRARGLAWPMTVALLVGAAAGMVLPRPFEPARAAQQPASEQQTAPAPLPFPGAQPPPTTQEGAPAGGAAGETGPRPGLSIATRRFEAPAAMIVNFVQPAQATAFEALTRRLVAALAESEDPQRRAQAAGWTMYRVQETGTNNNTLLVWLLDPAVANANYAVPQLLNELFPAEVQQLYENYNRSFGVGQMVLNLEPVVLVENPR